MELISVTADNRKDFLKFYKKQYLNSDLKRDTMSGLLRNLLTGKSELCKSVDTEPLMIVDKNEITMISVLAHAQRMPEYLQICFFESDIYNMDAFNLILDRAVKVAKEKGAHKLIGSLNMHVQGAY